MTSATARGATPSLTRHVPFSLFVRGWTNDVGQAVASISLGRHSQRKSFSHACNSAEFVLPHYRGGAVTPNAGGRRWRSQKRVRVVLSYARARTRPPRLLHFFYLRVPYFALLSEICFPPSSPSFSARSTTGLRCSLSRMCVSFSLCVCECIDASVSWLCIGIQHLNAFFPSPHRCTHRHKKGRPLASSCAYPTHTHTDTQTEKQ